VLRAAIVGSVSLLIAFAISSAIQYKFRLVPNFLLLSVIGPLFLGLGYRGMIYLEWLDRMPFAFGDLMQEVSSAFVALILSVPFVIYLLLSRLLAYYITLAFRILRTSPRFP